MERALELPQDVDALRVMILAEREKLSSRESTITSLREEIARLEQHNRVLAKWVFGRSSEKRVPEPADPALQGNLFVAQIAAEAERLAAAHRVVATVVNWHRNLPTHRHRKFPTLGDQRTASVAA